MWPQEEIHEWRVHKDSPGLPPALQSKRRPQPRMRDDTHITAHRDLKKDEISLGKDTRKRGTFKSNYRNTVTASINTFVILFPKTSAIIILFFRESVHKKIE